MARLSRFWRKGISLLGGNRRKINRQSYAEEQSTFDLSWLNQCVSRANNAPPSGTRAGRSYPSILKQTRLQMAGQLFYSFPG